MYKAVIIDDEAHCLSTLQLMLHEYCPLVSVEACCRSGADGVQAIHRCDPDVVFLDIEMPVMDGFEVLRSFTTRSFAVVFTSAHEHYAVKALHTNALDYLLKPIDPEELVKSVEKVQVKLRADNTEQFQLLLKRLSNGDVHFKNIAVPTFEGFELIPAEDVTRCVADDNYTHLFLKNGASLTACRTLKEVEAQLHGFPFFVRVHHSYIVNLNEVRKYIRGEGGYLVMSDGSTVNVSRSRKEALLRHFLV